MTYCVGISVPDGMVFVSDSRTNAGADHINTYSKLHTFASDQTFLVLLTAGNLATTQGVVAQIDRDIKEGQLSHLFTMSNLDQAAEYVGNISIQEQNKHANKRIESSFHPEASFILGGQIRDEEPNLVHIYPEGNFVHASTATPFLQIGEVKYGRPILDRIIGDESNLHTALMCGLVSMDSTVKSNATVGPPIEYLVYLKDSFNALVHNVLEDDDEYLLTLRRKWSENIRVAFESLPIAPGLDQLNTSTTTTNIEILRS